MKVLNLGLRVEGLGFYLVAERDGVVRHISRENRRKLTIKRELAHQGMDRGKRDLEFSLWLLLLDLGA